MKFNLKGNYKIGDTRIVTRFLLFPKVIGEELRWLEVVKIKQKLVADYTSEGSGVLMLIDVWDNLEFVT